MPPLSQFNESVIDLLTWRVRVAADIQLAKLRRGSVNVQRELGKLRRQGLVNSYSQPIVILNLYKPIFAWNPGYAEPKRPWQICWIAKKRIDKADSITRKIYYATSEAAEYYGGVGGDPRQPFQIQHDLGTTSTYLAYSTPRRRNDKALWVGEDVLRRFYRSLRIKKIPDAAIIADGEIKKVIDFVGRDYSAKHILRFHDYWSRKRITYELW